MFHDHFIKQTHLVCVRLTFEMTLDCIDDDTLKIPISKSGHTFNLRLRLIFLFLFVCSFVRFFFSLVHNEVSLRIEAERTKQGKSKLIAILTYRMVSDIRQTYMIRRDNVASSIPFNYLFEIMKKKCKKKIFHYRINLLFVELLLIWTRALLTSLEAERKKKNNSRSKKQMFDFVCLFRSFSVQ